MWFGSRLNMGLFQFIFIDCHLFKEKQMSDSNIAMGAYGPFSSEIDQQAKAAFSEAIEHFVGVGYQPVAVASQVVAGTNYAFFCNAKPVYPGANSYPAMVTIYKPLNGPAGITHIEKLSY
jgi:hypothetical protein